MQDGVPGMIGAIQTHGELLHWHRHIQVVITCAAGDRATGQVGQVQLIPVNWTCPNTVRHVSGGSYCYLARGL